MSSKRDIIACTRKIRSNIETSDTVDKQSSIIEGNVSTDTSTSVIEKTNEKPSTNSAANEVLSISETSSNDKSVIAKHHMYNLEATKKEFCYHGLFCNKRVGSVFILIKNNLKIPSTRMLKTQ